jgi:hypothetical protein
MVHWLWSSLAVALPAIQWRELGGPAVMFTFIRTYIFGKQLRTIEYPNGELRTINVRFSTVDSIKKQIAKANNITDFSEIKQLYRYEDNFWTEPILTPKDVRYLNDNNWILWSRYYTKIPSKNVNMKELNSGDSQKKQESKEELLVKTVASVVGEETNASVAEVPETKKSTSISFSTSSSTTTVASTGTVKKGKSLATELYTDRYKNSLNAVKIAAMKFASHCRNETFFNEEVEGGPLNEQEYQVLIDLLLNEDSYIISLYYNFKDDPNLFVKYARKKAQDLIQRGEHKTRSHSVNDLSSSNNSEPTSATGRQDITTPSIMY